MSLSNWTILHLKSWTYSDEMSWTKCKSSVLWMLEIKAVDGRSLLPELSYFAWNDDDLFCLKLKSFRREWQAFVFVSIIKFDFRCNQSKLIITSLFHISDSFYNASLVLFFWNRWLCHSLWQPELCIYPANFQNKLTFFTASLDID